MTKRYRLPRTSVFARRREIVAVSRVDLDLNDSDSLGLVGDSGAGKSTLLRLLLGLEPPDEGSIRYQGEWRRREVQIVFQDPTRALDPRMTVAEIVLEPLRVLRLREPMSTRLSELLDAVGLPRAAADRYPHEFSGGQRQRIAIARALAPRPRVLLADEPVSALDVSVRAQILNLLHDLRDLYGLALVLVSHDLSVVRHLCDRIAVMHRGEVVEQQQTQSLFTAPTHPYTVRLLEAIPRLRWRPSPRPSE